MATITTYLLVSAPDDPSMVREHALFDEYDFEPRETNEASPEQVSSITFALQYSLEEPLDLDEPVCQLSADVPEATVVFCEVEERFDQVERLQTKVFLNGKRAGEIEHGYVFNVGSG